MSPLFSNVATTLDINGPTLSFVRDPIGQVTNVARGKVEFTGIATATFPFGQTDKNTNTGVIGYQWYKNGIALQDNGSTVVGSATTTLSLSGLISPNDDNEKISLRVDYQPSAYRDVNNDDIIDQTGNAINDPIETNAVVLTVLPTIDITSQPQDQIVEEFDPDLTQGVSTDQSNVEATFTVEVASSNDDDVNPSLEATGRFLYSWWVESDGVPFELSKSVPDRFIVTIPTLPTITIKKDFPGRHLVYCVVSHTTADPGFIRSRKAELEVRPSRSIISYERIGNSNQVVSKGNRNLFKAGKLEFQADPNVETTVVPGLPATPSQNTIVLYAPERDVTAKVTMGGARGEGFGENTGGNGGLSVFKMIFKKNEEYVVRLGVNETQGFGIVGGTSEFGGGGGGMTVLYHKARVIAVCGGGGGAGQAASGGDGGGVDTDGQNGFGSNAGVGGQKYNIDTLPSDGNDNNGTIGGILGGCSEGNYWSNQGLTPCSDIATIPTKYFDKDGNEIADSELLIRGFKSGQGYRNNGGDAEVAGGYQGAGGSGARGGNAASANNSGGGGGSGYQSSEIELLNSFSFDSIGNISIAENTNRLGGNDDVGFISIELFEEESSGRYRIEQPQASAYSTSSIAAVVEKEVGFEIERDSGLSSTITFERVFGLGPKTITFGPETEKNPPMDSVLGENALYVLQSISPSNADYVLRNNTVQIDGDRDGTYNDLSITPNKGRFFLDQGNILSYIADWNAPENQSPTLDRPAPSIEFNVNVTSINRHTPDEAILSWSVTGYNVTDIEIDNGIGKVLGISNQDGRTYTGTFVVDPLNTTTYTLTAKNSNGVYESSIDTSSVTLTVNDQPPVIIESYVSSALLNNVTDDEVRYDESIHTIYNNPGRIPKRAVLRWSTIGLVQSMSITDSDGKTYALPEGKFGRGTFIVDPPTPASNETSKTTEYTINVTNRDGIISTPQTVKVTVNKQIAVVATIDALDGSDPISQYEHLGSSLKQITLQWEISANNEEDATTTNDTSSIVISGSDGSSYPNLASSGTLTVSPPKTQASTTTTTYTITATNIDNIVSTDATSLTVLNQPAVTINSFLGDGKNSLTYKRPGATPRTVNLAWQTTGAASNVVVTDNTGTSYGSGLGADSNLTVTPPKTAGSLTTRVYTLTVTNYDLLVSTATVPVTVTNQSPIIIDSFNADNNDPLEYHNPGTTPRTVSLAWQTTGDTTDVSVTGGGVNSNGLSADSNLTVTPPKTTGSDTTTTYTLTATNHDNITTTDTVNVTVSNQLQNGLSLALNPTSYTNPGSSNITYGVSGDFSSFELRDLEDNQVLVSDTNSTTFNNRVVTVGSGSTHNPDADTSRSYRLTAINIDNVSIQKSVNLSVAQQPPIDFDQELTAASTSFFHTSNSGTTLSWNVGDATDDTLRSPNDLILQQSTNGGSSFSNIQVGVGTEVTGFAVDPNPGETIFRISAINTDNIVRTSDVTVNVEKNPAPSVAFGVNNTSTTSLSITNTGAIQSGNAGTLNWNVTPGSGVTQVDLLSNITITNDRTGVQVVNTSTLSGNYNLPSSQLLLDGTTSFTLSATTIDGNTTTRTVNVTLLKHPAPVITASIDNNTITNSAAIQSGNSGASISWSMTGELKQVSGSVTITNVRTGTVIFSGNNDDNSGNYAIPGSELVVGDNRFDIKGITIDDEQKIERLSVNLKPAVKAVLTLTNVSGIRTRRKKSKKFMIRNSSDVQSNGVADAFSFEIVGDLGSSNSVVIKKGSTTVQTTNSKTGSFSIPASDIAGLTPGFNDAADVTYTLEVTNIDGIVASKSITYRLTKQPPVRIDFSASSETVFLQSAAGETDESTIITATAAGIRGGSDDL